MSLARPIADALRRGATVIAASPRAARVLQLTFADDQRAAGHTVWPAPAIRDWDSWLRDLWRDHAFADPDAPTLLSPLQERALWTRHQREDASLVLSPDSMAALAMDAWALLSAYNAHGARRLAWAETDAERFRHWAADFERDCVRHRWMSASQVEDALAPLIASGTEIRLPGEICLVGFDRLAPAQKAFLEALQSHATVSPISAEPQESRRAWVAAADSRAEIAACAAWAREQLLENPAARIGIIVPRVDALRGLIDRIFRRILMPASEDIRRPSALMPWEFSLGRPLAEVPAIHAALLMLRWIAKPLREEEISWLLLSGFVAGTATNPGAVARHDALARDPDALSPERSLESYRASIASIAALRGLHNDLGNLIKTAEANHVLTGARQPSAWCELAHLLLERAAWPGPRTPDSVQYQALQRWQRLLDDLSLLDFDGTRITFAEFLSLLESHAAETIFAPESHDAPVQILGPFESSGQQFDALWFLGTDDTGWPMRGRLHPLLPPAIQRQYEMPHFAPEDDWNLAHAVTARLLASAPRIVFSYAQRDKDAELRPSSLIAGLFSSPPRDAAPALDPLPAAPLEPIVDDSGVLPWPQEKNAGGAYLLKHQAACPFQAFATRRLLAEPLDTVDWGITPAAKGKLLHRVLERLFSPPKPDVVPPGPTLRSRDDIVAAAATNQLSAILDAHIDAAIREEFQEPSDPWRAAYLAAEKRRLHTRLSEWLEREAERQPFTVEACEQRLRDVHIGELRLNLRADRIDLLPDGTRFLLDYKTGLISPSAWKGDRPEEPQLPLYAAYGNVEDLSGILFAKIRAGETGFEGRVRDAQRQLNANLRNTSTLVNTPYTDAMRDEWARALENLAEEFLRGEASVDPRPKACTHCHFHGLCRVAEQNLAEDSSGGEENADA